MFFVALITTDESLAVHVRESYILYVVAFYCKESLVCLALGTLLVYVDTPNYHKLYTPSVCYRLLSSAVVFLLFAVIIVAFVHSYFV